MSLSKNPALVEFLVMVPPTASLPEYWAAGSAKRPLRHPVVLVSIYQSTSGSQYRSFRRALRWHQFPASQPPDVAAARFTSIALESPQQLARFTPESARSNRSDWLAALVVCRQLDDSGSFTGSRFDDDRDLVRTRVQQRKRSSDQALSDRSLSCGNAVLVRPPSPVKRQSSIKRQSPIERQSSVDSQSPAKRQPFSERRSPSERQPSEQQSPSERQPASESFCEPQPFTERRQLLNPAVDICCGSCSAFANGSRSAFENGSRYAFENVSRYAFENVSRYAYDGSCFVSGSRYMCKLSSRFDSGSRYMCQLSSRYDPDLGSRSHVHATVIGMPGEYPSARQSTSFRPPLYADDPPSSSLHLMGVALSREHLDPFYTSPKHLYDYLELPNALDDHLEPFNALDDHLEPPDALDKHIEHPEALKYVKYSNPPYDLRTIYDLVDIDSIDLTLDHTLYQILLLILLLTTIFLPVRLINLVLKPWPPSRMCPSNPSLIPAHVALMFLILCAIPTIGAVPTRANPGPTPGFAASASSSSMPIGSDSYPNMIKDWDFLPGMKRWNGQPFYDFARVWWVALVVALGTIVQDGNSLLACAEGTDEGAAAADPPDKVRQHNSRNTRLFACILNYINPMSRVYRIALTEFANDGRGLFVWLKEYGKLEYDDTTRRELLNEWDDATMAKVGIKFTPNAIWDWLDYVETLGEKLGRSLSQRRKKLLSGFPESFDVITSPERLKPDPGSYVLPTHYPPHHPKSGQPDPNAGRPDLYTLCKAFYPEWHHRIKTGQIRSVPRGSVYQVKYEDTDPDDDDNPEDDDEYDESTYYTSTQRKQITSRSVCAVCGGRGHFGRVEGMDCLTKQLGIVIPRSELALTKYPSGITFPFVDAPRTSSSSHSRPTQGAHLASSSIRRPGKPKHKLNPKSHKSSMRSKPKHISQVDDPDSDHVDHDDHDEQDDDKQSDGDPRVDFTALAVSYNTIDIRHNSHPHSDESSSDSSTHRRVTRRK